VVYSKLHLVDLAGSERTKKTESSGLTLKEANYINKSLSFLEQVVIALCERKREHVPYRQAKLTNILRDSIGGNCKTLMVANIWPEPSHLEETISTLKFASRMMRVSNEAIVNVQLDPQLLIKRYEKEIRDLKQELAMHDTLANRGRITYDQYSPEQQKEIAQTSLQYLKGEIEEIDDVDSLRKVREFFNQIRNHYRRLKQNIEATQRDAKNLPQKIESMMVKEEMKLEEEPKEGEDIEEAKSDTGEKKKRPPVDKQIAFIEYKEEGEGKHLENSIVQCRADLKQKRALIKALTEQINETKKQMDMVKVKLDHKNEEKKLQIQEDFGEDGEQQDEIIDEEELNLLKEMKDLKKAYREDFDRLKAQKVDANDLQLNIDTSKQQLIVNFENWYLATFEDIGVPHGGSFKHQEIHH